jgi:DNA polymerase-4
MDVYRQVSEQIREIFARYTEIIEPLSWDEAYLDVTHSRHCGGSATRIAQDIRATIKRETGLTASAGVAPIKFVAKVASDENKPDGLCVVTPDQVDEFVSQLPLKKIPGVGKVTLETLNHLGLFTCADVRKFPFARLHKQLGKFGTVLRIMMLKAESKVRVLSSRLTTSSSRRLNIRDRIMRRYILLPCLMRSCKDAMDAGSVWLVCTWG